MSHRRTLAAAVLIVLSLPQAAHAGEGRTTWGSETQGAPVSTMQGQWNKSDDERKVELVFAGGHLIQAGTSFTATWLTPFTTHRERPRFEHSYEMENINEFGKDITLIQSFRFRSKGGKWWPWMTDRDTLEPGWNFLGGGSLFAGGAKRSMQFEWRLSGTIQAPTYLRGSASLSIN